MTDRPVGDMPPELFRRHAREVADWIADYLRDVGDLPVFPSGRPGDLRAGLPPAGPESGEEMEAILADFRERILPGITHWNHPAFHAWFSITASGPGILGEMIAAALNVNAMIWRASPAATELEETTLDWLRGWLGLPEGLFGTINDTASHSTLYALGAAREALVPEIGAQGWAAEVPAGAVYTSAEAHSSVDKAALTLGFGREGIRRIEVDGEFRMRPDRLRTAIEEDLAAGRRPVAVVATLGTTSTTAIDPVDRIADLTGEFGLWLHVDAAYGGPLAILPEWRERFAGWERADSIVVNPHKWLFTPVDCSVLWVRDEARLRSAFSLVPEYLRTGDGENATNLMDYGVALGRRFRALKLWFVLRWFGRAGIETQLRHHLALAARWTEWVREEPEWEMAAPCVMATPIHRWVPAGVAPPEELDRLNLRVMEAVARSGVAFLSHTRVDGRIALRTSIGNLKTTEEDLRRTWDALRREAKRLRP